MKTNIIPTVVIAVSLAISGVIIYTTPQEKQIISEDISLNESISLLEAREVAKDFVNEKLLQGQGDISLENIFEESNLYKVDFVYRGQRFSSYISKDGRLFFGEGLQIENFDPAVLTPAPSGGSGMVGGC